MTLSDLMAAGFRHGLEWRRDIDTARHISRYGDVPNAPGVYLFVVNTRIQDVGSTLNSLCNRMRSYERRQWDGRLSRPVHRKLADTLGGNRAVAVYIREINGQERVSWAGLPVSVTLGVEAALITDLNPPWNRRGRNLLLDTESVREEKDEATL